MPKIKDIYGYEGSYVIKDNGEVYSLLSKGKLLKGNIDRYGYVHYVLYSNGVSKHFTAHRLVAIHFIPCSDRSLQVNHKDGNKLNNHVSNLEWCTNEENRKHLLKVLGKLFKGQNNPSVKLSDKDVYEIKEMLNAGKSQHSIAKIYNISRSTISMIAINKIWKNIS